MQIGIIDIVIVLFYICITCYLGWLGYRGTKNTADYLLAGRKTHPFIMALSYGATFISTSAIVGFGGVAGLFGMSLLWLTFLNIFVGVFIAFVFLGGPTRRIGHALDAHTFPELLGRRYQSSFIQVFAGLVIVLFMPLYGAAVLIGGTEFISTAFGMPYDAALLVFAIIVAVYVVFGGLKAVMYTDAFQGVVMFVGMLILLFFTYSKIGGVMNGHETLAGLKDLVPPSLASIGHQGWDHMPKFGFGDKSYNLWWIVVSTIVMGVGIGVMAQPQLVVRFMTVRSKRELNRAVGIGGVFILAMTGVAFTTGALSNAYFSMHGKPFTGRVIKTMDAAKGHVILQLMKVDEKGAWADLVDEKDAKGKSLKTFTQAPVQGADGAWAPVAKGSLANGNVTEGKVIPAVLAADVPAPESPAGGPPLASGRSISIVYAKANPDQIIPSYITTALPKWFGIIFLLTLLAAAMSTLSSQFHTLGTAAGRDVFERIFGAPATAGANRTVHIVRIAIILGLIVAVIFGHYARGGYIIARATAIFFGLCASAFLPAFIGGMFWKRMTKAGAIASMFVGFIVTAFWLVFVKAAEAEAIGLVQKLTGGKTSILADVANWPVVDPLLIALPLSMLTAIVVSFITRPPDAAHIERCFPTSKQTNA